MKTDRHKQSIRFKLVKLCSADAAGWLCAATGWVGALLFCGVLKAAEGPPASAATETSVSQASPITDQVAEPKESEPQALHLLQQVLATLVHGPAFDAKIRETVWTTGREVVGVGTYAQAGGGSGQFHLQLTMHDGDGKHRLQQISDGRLAWTRSEVAGRVSLRRVDVGRLGHWAHDDRQSMAVSPRLRVGAFAEMLSAIERDYILRVQAADLAEEPVWVITADLKQARRNAVLIESGRTDWPAMYPTQVRLAVRSQANPSTGFGRLLPIRIEYWSDPISVHPPVKSGPHDDPPQDGSEPASALARGRLITLIELYSIRPIGTPPPERFRFENQDAEVNFINETDRYIELYGIRLTDRQRREFTR